MHFLLFQKNLLSNGIASEIYSLINNEDVRPTANLVISKSTAYEYLNNSKPNLEKLTTQYYETFAITGRFTGYFSNITIGDFYNSLPSNLKTAIEPTRVISGYENNGTDSANFVSANQKLYLLSGVEVFGSDNGDTAASTTTQLEYYQGMETTEVQSPYLHTVYTRTYKGYNGSDGSAEYWWLRSARFDVSGRFRGVSGGNLSGDYPSSDSGGLSPAFRIA